jgi:hypothetical protein
MPANIAERPQHSLLVSSDDNRLAHNIRSKETFRIGNRSLHTANLTASMIQRPNKLPRPPKNARLLNIQNRRISIKPRSQRMRALDLFVDAKP